MSTFDESELIEYVTRQRWYGAKTRAVTRATLVDTVVVRSAEPELAIALVEMLYENGAHDLYQLFSTSSEGVSEIDGLAEDPGLAHELVSAMRGNLILSGAQGTAEFHPAEDSAALGRELGQAHVSGAEQSNTSIVFGDSLILKLFRRVEPGVNPDLEMLSFLTERGFANIPALAGWYGYSGGPLTATLGLLQDFVPDAIDGWQLALAEIAEAPERFLERLRRLGEVTGQMHSVLASDSSDPAFAPEEPSVELLSLLTATVDEEIARVFFTLPEDDERLAPLLGRGEEVREQLRLLTHAGSTGRTIRTHGDYHLGQTLWSSRGPDGPSAAGSRDGDWVIIDFEGEPARPLVERRRKRSPMRDVAGMLRSFAYAATASELVHSVEAPPDWEERAREQFLEGYFDTVDPTLLPTGQAGVERLLSVFELEKAVYELRYELDNRPDWVRIPVAGIQRLIDQAAERA